jgi:hypothetical protein
MSNDRRNSTSTISPFECNTCGILLNLDWKKLPQLPEFRTNVCTTDEDKLTRENILWVQKYYSIEKKALSSSELDSIRTTSNILDEITVPTHKSIDFTKTARNAINDLFIIEDATTVNGFINSHTYLKELLIEASEEIKKYFPEAELILEVISDPESDENSDELVLSILTDLEVRESIKRRNEFDRDWWLKNIRRTKGNLCIDIEYK